MPSAKAVSNIPMTRPNAMSNPDCLPADFVRDASGLVVTPAAMTPDSSPPLTRLQDGWHDLKTLVHQCSEYFPPGCTWCNDICTMEKTLGQGTREHGTDRGD